MCLLRGTEWVFKRTPEQLIECGTSREDLCVWCVCMCVVCVCGVCGGVCV